MGVHSKRGPSKAKQFRSCPGTFALISTVAEELRNRHGDAARMGTATHSLIEHCLKHGKNPDDMRERIIMVIETDDQDGASILREGAKMPKQKADHFAFIVDDDMIRSAEVATEYVRSRCDELDVPEKKLQLETRTNPLPDRDDTSGTADITIDAWPEVLEVDDYKNGYHFVEHTDNDQARAYLTGKAIETDWSHERYLTGIIQPNCEAAEGPVRVVEYTANELKDFQKQYEASIKLCEEAEAAFAKLKGNLETERGKHWIEKYLKPGDYCMFCDAGAICPARRQEAERLARIEFADAPTEIQLPAVAKRGAVVESTEEQVGRILAWAPFLDKLIRAAELYAHRAMEAGFEIPGQKLVAKRSNRKLIEAPAPQIVRDLVEGGFVSNAGVDKLYTARKLKSGPQIEKIVAKKLKKKFALEFLERPDNGTTIASVDDPRPSVEPRSAAEDFEQDAEEFDFG